MTLLSQHHSSAGRLQGGGASGVGCGVGKELAPPATLLLPGPCLSFLRIFYILKKKDLLLRESPGGAVAKTPCSQGRGSGFSPWELDSTCHSEDPVQSDT